MHNLDEYIKIRAANVSTDIGPNMINAVSTEKLGVVVSDNQLEDFFSRIS